MPNWDRFRPAGRGTQVVCQNCAGRGYLTKTYASGVRYPETCPGCQGSGKQVVK